MIHFASLFVLALAVSVDSFGVGITYGIRKVLIPIRSILVIAFCTGTSILLAMGLGQGIETLLNPRVAEMMGGLILVGIGTWALYQIFKSQGEQHEKEFVLNSQNLQPKHEKPMQGKVWTIEIKKLGIVIQVLRKPMMADIDRSGVITGLEAFVLGIALSLDAFGAGIGAALFGYSPLFTALVMACMSSLFVYLGMKFGQLFAQAKWISKVSVMPGIILILFGMMKIM